MSARASGGRGLVGSVLTSAVDWLIEPAEPGAPVEPAAVVVERLHERPVVAVVGLRPRCGTTVVARALAAELGARDPGGVAAVTAAAVGGAAMPLGLPAAVRLARTLAPVSGGLSRACGRLCLVPGADRVQLAGATRYLAPLVLDVDDPADASAAATLAGAVVLLGAPEAEPALAAVVAASLERVGPAPVVVLNRARETDERWHAVDAVELPEARLGAHLALAGREPPGELGRAVGDLADRCGSRG